MTFPQIVGKLIEDGFESYTVDYPHIESDLLPTGW